MEGRGSSDDVGNGVERSDLVEVDLIFANMVDFGFGFSQSLKADQCPIAYRSG
jgi:hypothetical protein